MTSDLSFKVQGLGLKVYVLGTGGGLAEAFSP